MGADKEKNAQVIPVHNMNECRGWMCTDPLILNVGARGA